MTTAAAVAVGQIMHSMAASAKTWPADWENISKARPGGQNSLLGLRAAIHANGRTEFFGIYFAERYKKHGKNQYRLQDADEPGYVRLRRLQDRNACVNEVRQCPMSMAMGSVQFLMNLMIDIFKLS